MLGDPAAFWSGFGTYEGEPIRLDPWQVAVMRDRSRLRAAEKAPQIGFSWTCAAEATWAALLFADETIGFVSVDQREAQEKILYARKLYEGLPEPFRRWVPLVKDSTEELWFGDHARPSRLMSIPATSALRGRRMSVYLDEVDFYRDGGRDAFRVAMGRITRGGRVTIGSTCFGVDTQLDRVMSGEERNFSRARLPWTVAENPEVLEAIGIAREELDPEDFAEEYECVRGGGGSTFSPDLIRESVHAEALVAPDDLDRRGRYVAGYDVGAGAHPSVLTILAHRGGTWRQVALSERRREMLADQETYLAELLQALPGMVLVLDALGLGMQASQSLRSRFGHARVIPMAAGSRPDGLPPMDRAEMVTELRRALEQRRLQLAADREQAQQFRRTRVASGKVDQPGSRKRTHYDRFWAACYAWYGVEAGARAISVYEHQELVVIGGRS